ncbi:carboxylesterase 1-like protein [Tanacetum coccineum]
MNTACQAAYDDVEDALNCIKSTQDPWLSEYAEFSNCYLMGSSAGANITYLVGLRVSLHLYDLKPLKIKGLILHHLFLGGVERMESEIRLANAERVTLSACDMMWNMSLPIDANIDHEYCNLIKAGSKLDDIGRVKDLGWRVMLSGCYGDLLIDRQMKFAKMLESKGVKLNECFYEGGYHLIGLNYELKAKEFNVISRFICIDT